MAQCCRLYTEADYLKFNDATVPEILRGNLATVVLQLMTMGVQDVVSFDYMDAPPADALEAALALLYASSCLPFLLDMARLKSA